jgi:hypothetical protein
MRRDPRSGYALLAALVVMVLAATFALALVGAVHALQLVVSAEGDSQRVSRLEADAAGGVLARLRWAPLQASGSLAGADQSRHEQWTAEWQVAPPAAPSPWPRRRVRIAAAASAARRVGLETVEVRAEDWAIGVSCERDADLAAGLTVTGSGLYVGGCLRGREHLSFTAGDAGLTTTGLPIDGARGGDCAVAAAHAGAGIFVRGTEIHDSPVGAYADDGDLHAGVAPLAAWVAGPSADILAAAQVEGTPVGVALRDGSLHLDAIGPADPLQMVTGRCMFVAGSDEVTVEGVANADAGRLLVIVSGDAVAGQPGETVALSGGLVVCGHLRVRGELNVEGFLHAGSLRVDAPASVTVPTDWRERALPGAARPVVVEVAT